MNEQITLLKSKGFELKSYSDGSYWVYQTTDEEQMNFMSALSKIYCVVEEIFILQTNDELENLQLYADGFQYPIENSEFWSIVRKMKDV